jgi:hypothetical protein
MTPHVNQVKLNKILKNKTVLPHPLTTKVNRISTLASPHCQARRSLSPTSLGNDCVPSRDGPLPPCNAACGISLRRPRGLCAAAKCQRRRPARGLLSSYSSVRAPSTRPMRALSIRPNDGGDRSSGRRPSGWGTARRRPLGCREAAACWLGRKAAAYLGVERGWS